MNLRKTESGMRTLVNWSA